MLIENKSALQKLVEQFSLSELEKQLLSDYIGLLEAWSQKINLVSKADVKRISETHIADSLMFVNSGYIPRVGKLLDFGSGAGFPGIPIAIRRPDLHVTLLDSKRKRALFLEEVASVLELQNVQVWCRRGESLELSEHELFDVVTARAVTSLPQLWQWASPLLHSNGILVAQKGGDLQNEMLSLEKVFSGRCEVVPVRSDPSKDKKLVILSQE